MWAYGAGYLNDPNNSVSTDPTYDPYQGGASNYVSTDPTYNAYGSASDPNGFGSGMWGALIKGIGSYAGAKASADNSAEMSKLSAEQQIKLAQQQREFQQADKQYKSDAVSKWTKYFG